MSSTFEKLSSNKVKLTFAVPAEKFEEGLKAAYHKTAKRFNIPGFRRGKAPMKVIENYYGPSVFYEEALDAILPDIYSEAVKEHDLKVVDRPEIDVQQIGRGQELQFTAEVFVRPDVELGEYKGLGIVKNVAEVTDDDVNAEIERARDRSARYVEVTDRPAKLDDQVNIDYAGFIGEEQFDGGTAKDHDLVLGSETFIPGFEDQLVGANTGDEIDVKVTFPENYNAEELAGKEAVFHVKVNSIHEKEMPVLDNDFVTEVSETANTVEEYKAEIRKNLEDKAEKDADGAFEEEILETVAENATVDIPEAMIEEQIDNILRDMEMRMMYQGMRFEDFLKYTGQSMEDVRKMYRQSAEQRVKNDLVIDAIRQAEGIEATDEEVQAEIAKYAERNQRPVEEFEKMLTDADKDYFRQMVAMQKTVDFLKANQ
ncbi:MAG: trigger factor [Clostridiales bacterium]|nr:trigger factor [Clostridiales bacterium]